MVPAEASPLATSSQRKREGGIDEPAFAFGF
jgi:hypothetical protein